ncbi:hypothetical protein BGX31_000072 [Mortierella sp. GBA43]|nr:hypothetical protein BGX31_000072 [Mortierella sp. GBA43]
MSPLASSASEDEFGRNRGGQPHHSNSDHNTGNVVDSGRSPRRRSKSSQRWGKRSSSSKSRNSKRRRTGKDNSGSSSSSSSSDSDTGSSSSEDSGHESYAPNGSSALRLHGIIHDLMLDLERARTRHAKYCEKVKVSARKVRNISKKLERHFRNLSESTLSAPASTEHPPMVHRTSNASEGSMPTVAMMPMRTSSQSSIVDRRAQPYSTATPQQHVPNPPRQRVTSQSMLSPTIERRPSGSSSNIRLAQTHNDRMTAIASADVIETLTNIHADVRNKAFGRKPRNMVLHDSIAGADLEDVLVTGSLEGSVDFWDLSNRRVVSTIPKDRLNQPWAEAMCWVGKNVLGVASAHKEGVQLNHQLLLVHVEKGRVPRASLGQTGTSVSWSVQTLSAMPHDGKGIACISSISDDADGMSLVTGGMDKQLVSVDQCFSAAARIEDALEIWSRQVGWQVRTSSAAADSQQAHEFSSNSVLFTSGQGAVFRRKRLQSGGMGHDSIGGGDGV